MVLSCQICLDIPEGGKIITGTSIRGIVKYELDKEILYKTISISLVLKAYCTWFQKQELNSRANANNQMRASESKLIDKIHLVRREKNDKTPLSVGSYEHLFVFNLPENIPPTFKNDLCEIKYNLVLKFKKASFFSINKLFKHKVHIVPRVPNSIPDDPVTVGLERTLLKLFTNKTRKITVKAELDKEYLTPNKDTEITYVVTNDSDIMPSVKVELIHITTYKDAQNNTKTEEKVVEECTVKTPCVMESSVANMNSTITVLPDLYTIRHSKIVMREFKLKFTLKLPVPHVNGSVDVPVFIGERELVEQVFQRDKPPDYWDAMYEKKAHSADISFIE